MLSMDLGVIANSVSYLHDSAHVLAKLSTLPGKYKLKDAPPTIAALTKILFNVFDKLHERS